MECLHASTVSSSSREAFVCLRSSPGSSIMAWFLSIAGISLGSACSSLSRQLVCRKLFMPYFHHTLPLQAAQSDFFHPPPWTVNFGDHKMSDSVQSLKKDPAWKYAILTNESDNNSVTCIFCGKITKGGITRHKQHLVGGFRNARPCSNCPEHVKSEIKASMLKKKDLKEQFNDMSNVNLDEGEGEDFDVMNDEILCAGPSKILRANKSNTSSQSSTSASIFKTSRPKGPWSIFEHLHSKRRSKLDHGRLKDLVYVKYNRALIRRFNHRDVIDPISLTEIDDANEWLTGKLDDESDEENDFIVGEEDLTWTSVAKATGVYDKSYNIRERSKGKEKESSFMHDVAIENEDEEGDEEDYEVGDNADEDNEAFLTFADDDSQEE